MRHFQLALRALFLRGLGGGVEPLDIHRHQFLRIFPHETTHDDLMTIDEWCCMMLSQNVTAQSAKLFNGSMDSTRKSKPLCPKERRTSHGGNQMSFPHCRPLAFVSLATFVIWDSATCQNHRDLTLCCRVWPWSFSESLRNVTPVAKELVDPNDRRIEKISYRALTNTWKWFGIW